MSPIIRPAGTVPLTDAELPGLLDDLRSKFNDGFERLAAVDLREIGCITELPLRFRHWVYRHRTDPNKVLIIGWVHRMRLQQLGYTEMNVFVRDDRQQN